MIEWGQKSKPKKIPRASNKTPKNPWTKNEPPKNPLLNLVVLCSQNYTPRTRRHYHDSSDCFVHPPPPKKKKKQNKAYLNQAT